MWFIVVLSLMSSVQKTAWFFPLPFASYIAISAFLIRVSGLSPSSGYTAMPMLAETWYSSSSITAGFFRVSIMDSIIAWIGSSVSKSGISTKNSSPPNLAKVPFFPIRLVSRCAINCNTRSPTIWPAVSLIALKESKSMKMMPTRLWCLSARSKDCWSFSIK